MFEVEFVVSVTISWRETAFNQGWLLLRQHFSFILDSNTNTSMVYFSFSSGTQLVWPKSHTFALNAYYFEMFTLRSRCTYLHTQNGPETGCGTMDSTHPDLCDLAELC